MWTVFLSVDVIFWVLPLRPVCAQQDPRACGDALVLLLPATNELWSHEIIRVPSRLCTNVDDASRAYKFSRRDAVHRVVGEIFSRDPVDGRIEMSTGVLTGLESVPVPGRTTLIVVRQLPDLERRSVGKLRRKRQQRGLRTQRLGKIHHTQTPGSKFFKQLRQNLRHSYSLLTDLLCAGDRLSTSGRRTRSLPL